MNLLNLEQRLETQSQYQRQKITNELGECREERLFNQHQYQTKNIKMDQQIILVKRDWQTSINIRKRKMDIV